MNHIIAFIKNNIAIFNKEKVANILWKCVLIILGAYIAFNISLLISSRLGYCS